MKHSTMNRTLWRSLFCLIAMLLAFDVSAKELHLLLQKSPLELNPYTYLSQPEWYIHYNITRTLVELDEENQIVAGLAKRWTVHDEGKTYIFDLDTDQKWSNGDPITPQDILMSMQQDPKQKSASLLKKIVKNNNLKKSIYLKNDSQLVIKLIAPKDKLLYFLSRAEFGIVYWPGFSERKTYTSVVQTSGDYKIESITDDRLILVKNIFSKRIAHDNPDKIIFWYLPSRQSIKQAIQTRWLDFYQIESATEFVDANGENFYKIINGGYDNLLSLQARNVTPRQIVFLRRLMSHLNKSRFVFSPNRVAHKIVAYSVLSDREVQAATSGNFHSSDEQNLTIMLSPDLDVDQHRVLSEIQSQSRSIGLKINTVSPGQEYRKKWENQDYEAALVKMGVYTYDEAELLNGYMCSDFLPYKVFRDVACHDIEAALDPFIDARTKKKHLLLAYRKILGSGYLIPLYFQPRRYFLSQRWVLKNANPLLPYPIFRKFYENQKNEI